jgi:spermidine/putrescine-binding protein
MKTTTVLVLTIFMGVFLSAATTPQEREASFKQHLEKGINIIAWDLYTDKKKINRGEYIVVLKKGKYSASETLKVI